MTTPPQNTGPEELPSYPGQGGFDQPAQAYGIPVQPYQTAAGFGWAPAPVEKPVVPTTVNAALWIYLASAALSIYTTVMLLTPAGRATLTEQIRNTPELGLRGEDLEAAIRLGITLGVAISVAILALTVTFAFVMRSGRNWARITLTVLSGLSAVNGLAGAATGTVDWTSWMTLILAVAAIVLMYAPVSNTYFRQAKDYRAYITAR